MTLQRVISAHAAARVALVIHRLASMQSHANSRQAGCSCIERLSLARPHQAWPVSLVCQSCSDIAVEGGERERQER